MRKSPRNCLFGYLSHPHEWTKPLSVSDFMKQVYSSGSSIGGDRFLHFMSILDSSIFLLCYSVKASKASRASFGITEVTGLLQTLSINSENILDMPQVLLRSNVSAQGGYTLYEEDVSEGNVPNEPGIYYTHNGYLSSSGCYVESYDYPICDWDDQQRRFPAEAMEPHVLGSSNENTFVHHLSGYAYNPQNIYASYSSGTPSRENGQFHTVSHGNPCISNVYQQSVLPNASMITSSAPTVVEALKKEFGDSSNKHSVHFTAVNIQGHLAAQPTYVDPSSGLHGRVLSITSQTPGSQDVRVAYEGSRTGAPWFGSYEVVEGGHQRHGLSSSCVFGQFGRPLTPLLPNVLASHMHPHIQEAAIPELSRRGLEQSARKYSVSANSSRIGNSAGFASNGNGHHWSESEKGKPWGRGGSISNNGRLDWDMFNQQNKGPRTVRGRLHRTTMGASRCSRLHDLGEPVSLPVDNDKYNRTDFETTHDNAIFLIIKSYSEDDIHKSIKYSIWASTVNGNKKLDAAYHEAQASSRICPLFLFFSVNASGQFCGVAEMVGPVDFNCSLDFWQQDKWTGKFPVKWHIVKDVPNSQFRHIVLENNDNKPVTNSRDTQEVPLSQGSEMLNIFKTHSLKSSILDDFLFYETRQRFMEEKKARQQIQLRRQQANNKGVKKSEQNEMAQSIAT
ncbi:hypothetical protein GOP47_0018817 [Adiantum capillus-veneris]|uniref:YTH domain-containing protein n=1 Tax=Adiantum capillus-veneris TaxID=13818 RepID=A0A9D4UDW8_ADICA|nr:hypothetical protein GOP47_0018817 [Adiantum capillus-veneris]